MSLADFQYELESCTRCSHCKFIPWPVMQSQRFSRGCPSADRFKFHAYSASGKIEMALSLHEGRIEGWTKEMQHAVFRCQMCGACQVACRPNNFLLCDQEEIFIELRMRAIEEGWVLPEHLYMIENLRKHDNPFGQAKETRAHWAEGLALKNLDQENAEVIFHPGCRYSYHPEQWSTIRKAAALLTKAGVDMGIFEKTDSCCGGRAYEIGYKSVMQNFADDTLSRIKSSGATTLVTSCGDCYGTFKGLYGQTDNRIEGVEIYHTSEYLEKLINDDKLKLQKSRNIKVTYHDPCHLGRKGEAMEPWQGEWKLTGPHIYEPVPEKPLKIGINGCYDSPRNVIKSIPGVELVEMERIKEYSWCCGAGAGVLEAYPDFAKWTATERIEEAKASGAEAIVTACGWCQASLKEAAKDCEMGLPVYDIVDLISELR